MTVNVNYRTEKMLSKKQLKKKKKQSPQVMSKMPGRRTPYSLLPRKTPITGKTFDTHLKRMAIQPTPSALVAAVQ